MNFTSIMSSMWPPATPVELFYHPFVAVSAILAYLFVRFIYRKYAYPRLFTPLKHIPLATPEPPSKTGKQEVTSSRKLLSSLKHAAATVPNNGLLRFYRDDTNERVLVTGVKALNDILVTNASAFVKPEHVRRRLYAFGGDGLLLSEGETHKVCLFFSSAIHSTRRSTDPCNCERADSTQRPHASILLPAHQRPLPHLLVKVAGSRPSP